MYKALSITKPHYHGHRTRLKERFLHTPEGFADYELLELLLCQVVPRMDMKPLAKALLAECGSLPGVLHASASRLKHINGVGDSVVMILHLLAEIFKRTLSHDLRSRQTVNSAKDVLHYCQQRIGFDDVENLLVLFLDNQSGIISDKIMQRGTVDTTAIYPREILKYSLDIGAASIILAHNHPGGDPTPSREDILMTQEIIRGADPLNIAVLDHIIVGQGSSTSLRFLGLMDKV